MMRAILLTALGLASIGRAAQPSAPKPVPVPLRDLQFGTLNFLHTTDTHGWHAGHLLEAPYGADWGDYMDFVSQMRDKIEADGNDILIIDTGDRVEGNGLYDASVPTGKYTFPIFTQQPMDIITTGNHELYKKNSSEHDFEILVPAYGDAYLSSNINISDPATGEMVPMANRYRKFTTRNQQIRILAFGFIFDFNRNFNNTVVQPVARTVNEAWFQEALQDDNLDLIIVTAHAAARSTELITIYKAIRAVHPDLPLQFFAGHQHIRDYKKFDDKAYVIASGRYMETIGFQSIDGIQGGGGGYTSNFKPKSNSPSQPLTYFRRYIDNNLYSYYHHTNTNATTFHSAHGLAVSAQIAQARKALNLDELFGCAPQDLYVSRVPFPSPSSMFTWLNDTVLPAAVLNPSRSAKRRLILFNSGGLRFDIYEGPFTRDSIYIISPFTNAMNFLPDVPLTLASKITPLLNKLPQVLSLDGEILETSRLAPFSQRFRSSPSSTSSSSIPSHNAEAQIPIAGPGLRMIPGYTTTDDAGTDGDDTIHTPITYYNVPNIIQSDVDPSSGSSKSVTDTDEETVDLVFNQYLNPFVLSALKGLGANYTWGDIKDYVPGETMTGLISKWVGKNWGMDC